MTLSSRVIWLIGLITPIASFLLISCCVRPFNLSWLGSALDLGFAVTVFVGNAQFVTDQFVHMCTSALSSDIMPR